MDINEKRIKNRNKKIAIGFTMALLCALFWGLWYIPGNMLWVLDPFVSMSEQITGTHGKDISFLVVAVLITGFNALTVVIALSIWNGCLGKFKEMKRTIMELRSCTKYFLFGAICGGPLAILGSFIAMGFIGAAFAAVSALLYPVIGTVLSSTWLGQKVSKRAIAGIILVVLGGISVYGGGLYHDLSAGNVSVLGYVGGAMAAIGWGIEGVVAAKGLDVSNPDVGIQIRFMLESVIWWVIAIPVLAIIGFPMYEFAIQIMDPTLLLVLIMAGLTFGFCYVSWYKSFPLIGVGRGQAIGSLYGAFAVIFIFIFTGSVPDWTIWVGGGACVIGCLIMFTENSKEMDCLRGEDESIVQEVLK